MEASCQCGKLCASIADDAEPLTILCHCTDCQKRSGSTFGVTGYFAKQAVKISGAAREWTRNSDSGNTLTNGFCPTCGSTVYVLLERTESLIGVPVGAISDPAFPAPTREVWTNRKHHWVNIPDGMASFEKGFDKK